MTSQQRIACAVVCAVWCVFAVARIVSGTGTVTVWLCGISSAAGLLTLLPGALRDRNR